LLRLFVRYVSFSLTPDTRNVSFSHFFAPPHTLTRAPPFAVRVLFVHTRARIVSSECPFCHGRIVVLTKSRRLLIYYCILRVNVQTPMYDILLRTYIYTYINIHLNIGQKYDTKRYVFFSYPRSTTKTGQQYYCRPRNVPYSPYLRPVSAVSIR